jgi:poly(3-hydroxybutyrate) depolymerase
MFSSSNYQSFSNLFLINNAKVFILSKSPNKRIIPAKGRRLLTISGENDPIIPYNGGKGVVGYTFLPAEKSAFIWAKVNGYSGKKLTVADSTAYKEDPLCLIFNYVNQK